MKIDFAETPPVGLALRMNGQRFDLVAHEPHQKIDGSMTTLLVWQAECATCGEGFQTRSRPLQLPSVRRCPDHRQPGKRVSITNQTDHATDIIAVRRA